MNLSTIMKIAIVIFIVALDAIGLAMIFGSHTIFDLYAQGGMDPMYNLGQGYKKWGYDITYQEQIKINDKQCFGYYELVRRVSPAIFVNNDWILGQARDFNDVQGYYSVRKLDISSQNFQSEQEAEQFIKSSVTFPVESIDKLSDIVGFNVSESEFIPNLPKEMLVNYKKAQELKSRTLYIIITVTVGIPILYMLIKKKKRICRKEVEYYTAVQYEQDK